MSASAPALRNHPSQARRRRLFAVGNDSCRAWMLGALLVLGLGQNARAAVLFVSTNNQILKVDSTTGAVFGVFTPTIAAATFTSQLVVTASGDFLLSDFGDDDTNPRTSGQIFLIDGWSGAVKSVFVAKGAGGLSNPFGMGIGPDGNLYVLDDLGSQWAIRSYNGTTGAAVGTLETINSPTFLTGPTFGPDGMMYVGDSTLQNVRRFNLSSGTEAGLLLPLGTLQGVGQLKFAADGTLYVAITRQRVTTIEVFNTSGSLLRTYSPNGLVEPNAMTFGPDGTLFLAGDEITGGVQAMSPSGSLTQLVPSSSTFLVEGMTLACDPAVNHACMLDGRYRAQVTWATPQGAHGVGHPIRYSDATSQFWFFSPDNLEMVVKVIDGCALNQKYWVFAGGLTDVALTMTVTDTQTGQTKTYRNPQSTAFKPIQDTSALTTCP